MELDKQQVQQLYPGITVIKKKKIIDQQTVYLFYLDVKDLNIIDFQIDFTGSQCISIKGQASHQKIVLKTVEPRQKSLLAQVQLLQGWKLKTKFRFLRKPISKQQQLKYILPQISSLAQDQKYVDYALKKIEVNLTPIDQIISHLNTYKNKLKFIDSQFPPQETSIVGKSDKNLIDDTVNHWRRPQDFFEKKPYFLFNHIHYENLIRGKLGDNAVYSVIVCLALTNPYLIEMLFKGEKQISQGGIYKLKLCKNGQWQTVTVDDYIPCQPLTLPKFISSRLNQIWVQLLQKAYAKVHKKYIALHQLQVSNVFQDFTGCPTIIQAIQLKPLQQLKKIIHQGIKQKYIVVFYTIQQKQFQDDQFIPLRNYAYPITGIGEDQNMNFYKILDHQHKEQQIYQDQISGKFNFLCICKVRKWEQIRIKGKFISIETAQNSEKNKQNSNIITLSKYYYSMDLSQTTELNVCLHQEDILIGNNALYKQYLYCSLLLISKKQNSILEPKMINNFAHNRQIQFSIKLQPGYYLIVPFVNSQVTVKRPQSQDPIPDIFKKLDMLIHRELKYGQLDYFYKIIGEPFKLQTFQQLLKKYTNGKKGLGLEAFRQLCNNNKILWKQKLEHFDYQRLFILSFHSNLAINVQIKNNIGTQLNNRAHCQLISVKGKDLVLVKGDERYAKVKFLVSPCSIVEYMVENRHDMKIEVTLDFTQSIGYNFVPKSGKVKAVLDSGQKQFIAKLIPMTKIQYHKLERKQKVRIKIYQ